MITGTRVHRGRASVPAGKEIGMDNRPIGVFDSGLGGLTAVRELRQLLGEENVALLPPEAAKT